MIDPLIMLHIAFGGAAAGVMLTGVVLWQRRDWSWLIVTVPGILLGLSLGLLLAFPMIEMGRSLHSLPAMMVSALVWLPPTLAVYRKMQPKQSPLTSR